VAGGANAAVRARRLSESAQITIFERGPFVSFANCGLPYYIGGEIAERKKLTVQTPEGLTARFNLTVQVLHEVEAINPPKKVVTVRNIITKTSFEEEYDDLIIATGASPIIPKISGIDSKRVFTVRDIPDVDRIKEDFERRGWKKVGVVGGGYIGLEMVEQLHRLGVSVSLLQGQEQVMMQVDPEMASLIHQELTSHGIELTLNDPLTEISEREDGITLIAKSGKSIDVDAAILGLGVRPEVSLAQGAGIELGTRGGIKVNRFLETSIPHIWAVGDVIEVENYITHEPSLIALAGPANRQGRSVANSIFGNPDPYDGTLGTAVIRVFDLTIACTGINERALKAKGTPYHAIHLHPNSHAGYYPGAHPIALKLLFSPTSGEILGAQAIGRDGVEKRIDVIATAIKGKLRAQDLVDLELCYAPPFGSAKDPVNIAGMIAENVLSGLVTPVTSPQSGPEDILLDVRDPSEIEKGIIPGALHIPLNELRSRLNEIPREKRVIVYCQSGQRSYYACRILMQNGYTCRNLSGAYKTWSQRGVSA
jgi:NADPH-dependent 2,4-dienoyl-CoA reductase/sulfur reductase-like enzyme/rhodanese-related sulfurtransferase